MTTNREAASAHDPTRNPTAQQTLESVVEALERLRYGAIQITIHDGRAVQIDVTERRRFS